MRGTLLGVRIPDGAMGIIPAYAGNTPASRRSPTSPGDHPRVCGEHLREVRAQFGQRGSSPRMRGTPYADGADLNQLGIIPAYAGNTVPSRPSARNPGDHPRVCGEHLRLQACGGVRRGSSPRMRGTLVVATADSVQAGIIPAYAGNTSGNGNPLRKIRDHPRVCGEHTKRLA